MDKENGRPGGLSSYGPSPAVSAVPASIPDAVLLAAVRATIINTPETADFMAAVPLEAAHQRERWGVSHDAGKAPEDWFWLLGYLGGKALHAAKAGDVEKAKHHTISTAAALANWHAALAGAETSMRPGTHPPDEDWFCDPCRAVNRGIRRVCRFCKKPRAEVTAQGTEAGTAEPLCVSVHDGPVGEADAPEGIAPSPPGDNP